MRGIVQGFLFPLQGLRLIFRPGFRRYVVVPLLLNIVIFALLAWLGVHYFEGFMDHYLPEASWWSFVRPLLWVLFALAYAMTLFYGFTVLANLVASPFNSILAAKIEEALTGRRPTGAETGVFASIWPAVSAELNKFFYMASRMIPLLVLWLISALIPGLNLIVSALWLAAGFWFLTLEYLDYPMANHDLAPKQQRRLLGRRRLKSLAFGSGVTLLMLVLGFVAMPASVAGATLFWVRDLQQEAG
ncbi:MAG: sulfate transporter CysZ [Gammaproteobacteria bacterium]|nr:MAG: sulfate transporter CysZ [Gammaproteobacteria bacterium]